MKIRIYENVIRPTTLYGCETWVLNQVTREILRRWERKLLRRILKGETENGCIRRTNEEIYESYHKPQIDSIIKTRLQWLDHIERVTKDRTVRRIARI